MTPGMTSGTSLPGRNLVACRHACGWPQRTRAGSAPRTREWRHLPGDLRAGARAAVPVGSPLHAWKHPHPARVSRRSARRLRELRARRLADRSSPRGRRCAGRRNNRLDHVRPRGAHADAWNPEGGRENRGLRPWWPGHAACTISPWRTRSWLRGSPRLIPAGLGLFSGLSFCPPLLVALTQGALHRTFTGSVFFFACFFVGTSAFFLPTPFLGALRRQQAHVHVGSFSAVLVGLYYLYSGSMRLLLPAIA